VQDTDAPGLDIRLLGSVRVRYGDRDLNLDGVLPKSLLAALVLSPGQTLPKGTVIEALWGTDPQALEIYKRLGMRADIDRVQARLAELDAA
jgi:hypothetical protein